jgi:hypothetical protein
MLKTFNMFGAKSPSSGRHLFESSMYAIQISVFPKMGVYPEKCRRFLTFDILVYIFITQNMISARRDDEINTDTRVNRFDTF